MRHLWHYLSTTGWGWDSKETTFRPELVALMNLAKVAIVISSRSCLKAYVKAWYDFWDRLIPWGRK